MHRTPTSAPGPPPAVNMPAGRRPGWRCATANFPALCREELRLVWRSDPDTRLLMSDNEVAVAQDTFGRSIYASDGSGWFRLVPNFPSSGEEGAVLYENSLGPKFQLEELQVLHDGAIRVIQI